MVVCGAGGLDLHDTWPFCGSEHYPLDAQDQLAWASRALKADRGLIWIDGLGAQRQGVAIVVATAAIDRSVPLDG